MGGFNILNKDIYVQTADFIDTTRITTKSVTLIDNIFSSKSHTKQTSRIIFIPS